MYMTIIVPSILVGILLAAGVCLSTTTIIIIPIPPVDVLAAKESSTSGGHDYISGYCDKCFIRIMNATTLVTYSTVP